MAISFYCLYFLFIYLFVLTCFGEVSHGVYRRQRLAHTDAHHHSVRYRRHCRYNEKVYELKRYIRKPFTLLITNYCHSKQHVDSLRELKVLECAFSSLVVNCCPSRTTPVTHIGVADTATVSRPWLVTLAGMFQLTVRDVLESTLTPTVTYSTGEIKRHSKQMKSDMLQCTHMYTTTELWLTRCIFLTLCKIKNLRRLLAGVLKAYETLGIPWPTAVEAETEYWYGVQQLSPVSA